MANSEIITLVHSVGNKNNNIKKIKHYKKINKKNAGQRAKLAARPPGILPVLPMASPPLHTEMLLPSASKQESAKHGPKFTFASHGSVFCIIYIYIY